MNRLPPRLFRRLVLAPVGFVLCVLLVLASPLTLLAAAVVDLFSDRRMPTLRMVAFGTVYALCDALGLVGLLVLWVASLGGLLLGHPRFQAAHYALMRLWIAGVDRAARGCFRLRIHILDRPERRAGPVLVFSRHAGPGNSLMLLGVLMIAYRRRPRVVMLAKLQWEPFFDGIGNRLPNRFIRHDPARREQYVRAIGTLAAGTGDLDAFVLFPEGKDFTPRVRQRAIASLRRRGHEEEARKAERMERVLPPRHGGVLAAVTSAPEADVVFVAHTVLEDVGSVREIRRRVPLDRPILSRYWRVPAGEVPREEGELIPWLYDWWARIDEWIDAHVPPEPAAVDGPDEAAPGGGPDDPAAAGGPEERTPSGRRQDVTGPLDTSENNADTPSEERSGRSPQATFGTSSQAAKSLDSPPAPPLP